MPNNNDLLKECKVASDEVRAKWLRDVWAVVGVHDPDEWMAQKTEELTKIAEAVRNGKI